MVNSTIPRERGIRVPQRRGKGEGAARRKKGLRDFAWRLVADLGPGLLVFLERINFHPTLENRHGVDAVSLIDQFLDQVGKGRLADAAGFVKPRRLIPLLRATVAVLQRLRAF